jgi:hypothetical protein
VRILALIRADFLPCGLDIHASDKIVH